MPIDQNFTSTYQKTGRHHDHDVWGEDASKAKLGVHGTAVAVDFDLCTADGSCLPVCPVNVFEWLKNPGKSGDDEKLDSTDKADPIREVDCIFCMACETVCPPVAIKITPT
jgi:NAD-dependent dihydropyrimidine dehydrogenase PreA subunit